MITNNFQISELFCKCGCGLINTPLELIEKLQLLADRLGSININCAIRCPKHNKEVGGADNSLHLMGLACDISAIDTTHERLCYAVKDFYDADIFGGVILYDTFVHVDLRRKKYFDDRRGK